MQIAQGITNPGIGDLGARFSGAGSGAAFLGSLLSTAITIILIVGGLYFFFQFLTGGVSWIGSGGDKVKLEEARSKIFSAGIGLVLLFSAWAVITLIENVFSVGILNFDIPVIGQTRSSLICFNCSCPSIGGDFCQGACLPGGCAPSN